MGFPLDFSKDKCSFFPSSSLYRNPRMSLPGVSQSGKEPKIQMLDLGWKAEKPGGDLNPLGVPVDPWGLSHIPGVMLPGGRASWKSKML